MEGRLARQGSAESSDELSKRFVRFQHALYLNTVTEC